MYHMIQGSDVGALARSGVRVAGWQANFERAHGIEDELIVECTVEAA